MKYANRGIFYCVTFSVVDNQFLQIKTTKKRLILSGQSSCGYVVIIHLRCGKADSFVILHLACCKGVVCDVACYVYGKALIRSSSTIEYLAVYNTTRTISHGKTRREKTNRSSRQHLWPKPSFQFHTMNRTRSKNCNPPLFTSVLVL